MKRFFIGVFILMVFVYSCQHETTEPIGGVPQTTSTTSTTVSGNDSVCFNTQIQPLFNSNCAMSGCHDAISHQDGFDFTNYTGIMAGIDPASPVGGDIMEEIIRNRMPEYPIPPLDSSQKALLTKWIREGATNRQCTDPCNPSLNTFAAGVRPILQANCIGCHNNNLPSGGINLSSYTHVKATVSSGKLLCTIQRGSGCSSMPKNLPKLDDNCIALIQNWINNGALDN